MTHETTNQDIFLRELAEAVGWEFTKNNCVVIGDTFGRDIVGWYDRERKKRDVDVAEWLLTNDGMMYLIQRARAEGWKVYTYRFELVQVVLSKISTEGRATVHQATNEDELLATAYAVGKIFKV